MCQARLPPTKSGELGGKAPNHKQISNLKFKIPNEDSSFEDFWFWILSIVWYLVFGIFPNQLYWFGGGRKARMTPDQHGTLIPWATHAIQCRLQRVATE